MNTECDSCEIFTVHCSESFVGVASKYIIFQKADIVIVPSIDDASTFICETSKFGGSVPDTEVLAFLEVSQSVPRTGDCTVMKPEKKLLLFMKFIEEWNVAHSTDYPTHLAQEAISLVDDMLLNCVDLDVLYSLRSYEFSEYWQGTADFLYNMVKWWKAELSKSDLQQCVRQHCNDLLRKCSGKRVVISGVVFNKLFVSFLKLLVCIVPECKLIIPYIDLALPEDKWQILDEGHYQYCLMCLLRELGISRSEIKLLGTASRNRFLETLFNFEISCYEDIDNALRLGCTKNVQLITCASEAEEAVKVMEILRSHEILSTDCNVEVSQPASERCALFTGSNSLAGRVDSLIFLEKTNSTDCDYSYLIPILSLCVLDVVLSRGDAVRLLSMLKHPFVRLGYCTAEYTALLSEFELQVIRKFALKDLDSIGDVIQENCQQLAEFWQHVSEAISPLFPIAASSSSSVWDMSVAHLHCLKLLTRVNFADHLGPHSEALERIEHVFSVFNDCREEMSQFFTTLRKYREVFSSLMHANFTKESSKLCYVNLLKRETVILSGFSNCEEQTPYGALVSAVMREKLGLPSTRECYGRALYVLYSFCYAENVYITRTTKSCVVAAIEPLWMRYLRVLLKGSDPCDTALKSLGNTIIKPQQMLAPNPEAEVRGRVMSTLTVRAVETLIQNPYAFYVRYILGISPIGKIATPSTGNFNGIVHNILQKYLLHVGSVADYCTLTDIARHEFELLSKDCPYAQALWWPKFEKMALHFWELDSARKSSISLIEGNKSFAWNVSDRMKVVAKCDRVEYETDGDVKIVCYKVGTVPSKIDVQRGVAPRAVLEVLCVAESTGLERVSFAYWKITPAGIEVKEMEGIDVNQAKQGLEQFLLRYVEERFPFFPSKNFSRFAEYELLSRTLGDALCTNSSDLGS